MLLTGCPEKRAVWVIPGSTAEDLVFATATERNGSNIRPWRSLVVERCAQFWLPAVGTPDRHWELNRVYVDSSEGGPAVAGRIRYGHVPDGYRERRPAQALLPGCYVAAIGSNSVSFRLDSTTRIQELSPAEAQRLVRANAAHDSAR